MLYRHVPHTPAERHPHPQVPLIPNLQANDTHHGVESMLHSLASNGDNHLDKKHHLWNMMS